MMVTTTEEILVKVSRGGAAIVARMTGRLDDAPPDHSRSRRPRIPELLSTRESANADRQQ
jgi:hypothetical protein